MCSIGACALIRTAKLALAVVVDAFPELLLCMIVYSLVKISLVAVVSVNYPREILWLVNIATVSHESNICSNYNWLM